MQSIQILSLLIICALLQACKTNAFISKEQSQSIEFATYEGIEFLSRVESAEEIKSCLGSSKNVGMQLREPKNLPDNSDRSETFKPSGLIYSSIPDRISRETAMFQFFACANPKGDIILTRLLSETIALIDPEEKMLLLHVLESKVAAHKSAQCLECFRYTRRIN